MTKIIPESSRELTPEKAYVLSVIGPGDGSFIFNLNKKNYGLRLEVLDREFVEKFKECLEKVYNLKVKSYIKKQNPNNLFGASLYSKKVLLDVLRYGKMIEFKHFNEIVPQQIKNSSKEIKSWYLKGFFDSQGTVCINKNYLHSGVRGFKKNKKVLGEIKELLKDLEIKSWVCHAGRNTNYFFVEIKGYKNLKLFYEKVGFSILRKQEKLKKVLASFKRSNYV